MNFENQYNVMSPAVKRLMREASEMHEPTEDYSAAPINDNLFEWHFTIRGASETDFDGGIYHGRIIFPSEYPMKPPNIVLLTPNGRFETNKKICLSISGHHPETWQPSWCVRTALLALIAFMPTSGNGTVGALDYSPEERRVLAKKSKDWKCTECGKIADLLLSCDDAQKNSSTPNDDEKDTQKADSVIINEADGLQNSETVCSEDVIPNNSSIDDIAQNTYSSLNTHYDNVSQAVPDVQFENVDGNNTAVTETPLLNTNLISSTFSNLSNSRITISVIVILIALLLYRRIFLMEYK